MLSLLISKMLFRFKHSCILLLMICIICAQPSLFVAALGGGKQGMALKTLSLKWLLILLIQLLPLLAAWGISQILSSASGDEVDTA